MADLGLTVCVKHKLSHLREARKCSFPHSSMVSTAEFLRRLDVLHHVKNPHKKGSSDIWSEKEHTAVFTLTRGNNELNELTLSFQKNATQSHKC